MSIFREDRNEHFDTDGNLVTVDVVQVDITEDAVTYDLHQKVRAAIIDNTDAIDHIDVVLARLDTDRTRVQPILDGDAANVAQINVGMDLLATSVQSLATVLTAFLKDYGGDPTNPDRVAVLKQLTGIERLLIGSDLLQNTNGT